MTHVASISKILVAAAALSLSTGDLAFAQDRRPPPETRKSQVMRKPAFDRIAPVQELLTNDKCDEALAKLREIDLERFNDYEKAVTFQMFGYGHSCKEDYRKAIDSFEKAIATNALAPNLQTDLKFNVAQLYRAIDNLSQSLRLFEEWLSESESPSGSQYFQIASTYYQAEKYKQSLPLAQKALASNETPPENWLNLIVALYLDDSLKDYAKAAPYLEQLATRFPKPAYWKQLAAIYTELKQEKKSLVALELAYQQGFLTENIDLRRLGEMYLYHEWPYKGAILVQKEIDAGRMEKDERNWELLANAWFQARELDKAIPPLERAAALSKNGEHYMTIAQLHLDGERWADAEASIRKALDKGDLKSTGKAYLLRGIALFNQGKMSQARESFLSAQKFDDNRKQAAQWMKHMQRTIEADSAE